MGVGGGAGLNPSIHIYFFAKTDMIFTMNFSVGLAPLPFNLVPTLMPSVVDAYLFHKSVEYLARTFNLCVRIIL